MQDKKTKKKALICVGAPKAGTTWLYHEFLKYDDRFNFPKEKELNFWNCAQHIRGKKPGLWKRFPRTLRKIFSSLFGYDFWENYPQRNDELSYLDFTPDYMSLSEEKIHQINALFDEVKVILCIREPVARIESHYNYALRKWFNFYLYPLKAVYHLMPKTVKASSYTDVYEKWCRCIGNESVLVTVYEDMVANPDCVAGQIGDFAGIDFTLGRAVVNKTEYKSRFSEALRTRIKQKYAAEYAFWERSRTCC